MNALTDQSMPWLMTLVAIFAAAMAVIIVALTVFVPPLWSAGLAWMRSLLPSRARVINFEDRRAELRRVMGSK